jgi:hypothetical protein
MQPGLAVTDSSAAHLYHIGGSRAVAVRGQARCIVAALRGAGANVLGPCPTEEIALQFLEEETPTAAIVDVNLGGSGAEI